MIGESVMHKLNNEQQIADPVLVTGGAGFIGSHVVRRLVSQGHRVRVFELHHVRTNHLPRQRVEIFRGDLRRFDDIATAMVGCPTVLHLAADPNLWHTNPHHFEDVNHHGTCNVLRAAIATRASRIVHVSTESILSDPNPEAVISEDAPLDLASTLGAYCESKMKAELAAQDAANNGLPVVIASPSVPVGPGDHHRGPMTRLIEQVIQGRLGSFYLPGPLNLIDVRDAAEGICRAAALGRTGQRYLLTGENWTVRRLMTAVAEMAGRPGPRWRVPYPVALVFAALEEQWCRLVTGQMPLATVTGVRLTRRSMNFDSTATQHELGLSPRSCHRALADTVEWVAQQARPALADRPFLVPMPQPFDGQLSTQRRPQAIR